MSDFDADDISNALPPLSTGDTVITSGRRRVAIVTPTLRKIGGTEVYLWRLINVLREMGFQIRAYTQDKPEGGATESEVDGVTEVRCGETLSESLWPPSWAQRAPAVAALATRIIKEADIVNFHRLAPLDLVRRLRGGVPLVMSLHTVEMTCPSGGRFLPKSGKVCERRPGWGCLTSHFSEGCLCTPDGKSFPWRQRLRSLKRRKVSAEVANAADLMIFNSNSLMHNFRTQITPPRAFKVITPPVTATQVPAAREPDLMLFVGRLETAKGVFDALEVASRLTRTRLEFCGEGRMRDKLAQEIAARKLGERVILRGWLDDEALAQTYARASCLLLPSLNFEAFGMAGPEAIAHGCPVAAYDSGGIREWCAPAYGSLAPTGNVSLLTIAAERWLERMKAGLDTSTWRQSSRKRWSVERFTRDYVLALEELIDRA